MIQPCKKVAGVTTDGVEEIDATVAATAAAAAVVGTGFEGHQRDVIDGVGSVQLPPESHLELSADVAHRSALRVEMSEIKLQK
jgi:hypothetical protein